MVAPLVHNSRLADLRLGDSIAGPTRPSAPRYPCLVPPCRRSTRTAVRVRARATNPLHRAGITGKRLMRARNILGLLPFKTWKL
jgi:hypothetical protein